MNNNSTDKLSNLVSMVELMKDEDEDEAEITNSTSIISALKYPGYEFTKFATMRSWLWQICNEQAAFSSLTNTSTIFGAVFSLE